MKQLIFSISFIFISCLSIIAQDIHTITVIDNVTSEPLVGATILADDIMIGTSNYNGEYTFENLDFAKNVTISYLGYDSYSYDHSQNNLLIRLSPSTTVLDNIVVSANRDARQRSEAPVSISTLSSQLLKDNRPARLEEVLNKVSGVYMVDLGNEQHTMAIRQPINYKGLFLYLEDGLPIRPTGVFNHNALLEMNMAALQRIEVIRGPSSSLYGSEAIGGAINFITLRPSSVPSGRIGIQANNLGYRRVDFNASTSVNKLGIGASGYYAQRKDGFRAHSDYDKLGLTLRADYLINDQNTLTWDATYVDYYADMTGSLDSTFFYSKNYSSQQTFTNRKVNALRTKLAYNRYWNNESKTTIVAFARNNSIKQNPSYRVKDDYSPWANPDGDKNLAHGEINDNSVSSMGLLAQHNQKLDILSGANFSIGTTIDNSPNTFNAKYIAISKSDQNIYTGFTETDSVLTDYKVDLINLGAYANFDVKLTERLQATASLRYDQLNFDFHNNLDENAFSGAPDDIDNFSAITPKVGLTYKLNARNGLFANFSQGFLPPQISELYRGVKIPTLTPAKFNNYEVGGWFNLFDKVALDFSIYQLDGTDEIISVKLDDGSRINQNAGKTQHRGIEYGINANLSDQLFLRFSGTNASHQFLEYNENGKDYSDNTMGQAPSWIANAEVIYKPTFLPGFRSSLEWQHIDSYYMDNANSIKYPGYDIFNLKFSYRYQNIEVWTNIMNVTDELYATVARRSRWGDSYSLGEPRAFNVGLAYNFRKLPK